MDNTNLELYKVFYFVSIEKNLTKAAQRLFISQPAITQSIKKLEEQMGYSLFYRTKHGMNLTEAGTILYNHLQIPMECILQAKQKLKDEIEEENCIIRIGAGNTLFKNNVIEPLKKFKKKYPNVIIEVLDGSTKELFQQIENNLLDILLINLPTMYNTNYPVQIIEKVQDAFIASKDLKEYQDKCFSFQELNELPLVLQKSSSSSKRFLEKLCKKYNTELKPSYELLTYSLVLDFVKAGLAVGFINKNHIKKEIEKRELYEIKTNFKIPPREIGLIINPKKNNNPTLQDFIHYLKKEK